MKIKSLRKISREIWMDGEWVDGRMEIQRDQFPARKPGSSHLPIIAEEHHQDPNSKPPKFQETHSSWLWAREALSLKDPNPQVTRSHVSIPRIGEEVAAPWSTVPPSVYHAAEGNR